VLAEELHEGRGHRTLVLVHDRDEERRPVLLVEEESLRDDRDHEDRHHEREHERRAIAEEDAEVLAEDREHQDSPLPDPTFARRRSSSPWNESFATAASNCERKFLARLTPSTSMSVARQPPSRLRSV